MITKAVIPVAGLGTRLLTATKEQPKEMLPIFAAMDNGELCLAPVVQLIFEHLYDFGIREFYFVVGKEKRAVEDHFTPDRGFLNMLSASEKRGHATQLEKFYNRIEGSSIVWVNQPGPKGFGDAVRCVHRSVASGEFLVHAGDTYIVSKHPTALERLANAHAKGSADATLLVKEVHDPRQYGIAELQDEAGTTAPVKRVEEKPERPRTNLALMPLYMFNSSIFDALKQTGLGKDGELQLTDAVQKLIDMGRPVQAVRLSPQDIRLDIGSPETYWEALQYSHNNPIQ
jgi:UTP--glucose-1-phosphate uridylyltransferase